MLIYKAFGEVQRFKTVHLLSKIPMFFFWHPFWESSFDIFKHRGAEMFDFEIALAPS